MEVYIYSNFIQKYDKSKPIISQMMNFPVKKINELGNKLNELLKLYNELDNEKFFNKILQQFNCSEYLKTTSDRKIKSERIVSLKGYIKDTPSNELLNLFNDLTLETVKDNKSKVSLLTIHKSKGLEFKCVFIIGCNEGIIPPIDIKKDAKDEERRCLYVAITRAREVLYITSSTIHYINGVKKKYQLSSFLKETGLLGKSIITKYYDNN